MEQLKKVKATQELLRVRGKVAITGCHATHGGWCGIENRYRQSIGKIEDERGRCSVAKSKVGCQKVEGWCAKCQQQQEDRVFCYQTCRKAYVLFSTVARYPFGQNWFDCKASPPPLARKESTSSEPSTPRTIKSDEVTFDSTGNGPRDKTIELLYSAVALGSYAGKRV